MKLAYSWDVDGGEDTHSEPIQELGDALGVVVRTCIPYGRIFLELGGDRHFIREGDTFDLRTVAAGRLIVKDIPGGGYDSSTSSDWLAAVVSEHAGPFVELELLECPPLGSHVPGRPLPSVPFYFYRTGAGLATHDFPWDVLEVTGFTVSADVEAYFSLAGHDGTYALFPPNPQNSGGAVRWACSAADSGALGLPSPVVVARQGGPRLSLNVIGAGGTILGTIYARPRGGDS